MAQRLLTPTMRSTKDFDRLYPRLRPALSDWTMEFLFELHNAGLSQAIYVRVTGQGARCQKRKKESQTAIRLTLSPPHLNHPKHHLPSLR
ncbi:MAG: hypothetical protein H6665_00025 [Ardenticatenaceae bacterium]|nr:hypothetical protein [Ardenticatenaceae bacterium]